MKYNHLNVPTHWENYWTRYPEGHTILEALISWVSQVDSMVDNQNKLNDNVAQFRNEIDEFVGKFDEHLQDEVIRTLEDWQASGFINVVISEAVQWQLDDYIATNEEDKLALISQVEDLHVNVRKFKTDSNTWNMALQEAVDYGSSLYSAQTEAGGLYIPQNVTIKMPRGRYLITETIIGKQGLNFDFTGVVFAASPSDKSIDFLDLTSDETLGSGRAYRNLYEYGSFAGFHTVYKILTNNTDSSNLVFNSPTFQACKVGIDTVSYEKSRSTYMEINNMYSIKTDQPVRTHTDLTAINGGWIYHSGWNGASIYNQGFTKMVDVVGVPSPRQEDYYEPRWVDNHTVPYGGVGTRGIEFDHCRFGGEPGSCPVVFNYATHDNSGAGNKSVIELNNTQVNAVGTAHKSAIVLFEMPNYIKLTNMSGFINLTDGIIKVHTSLDVDSIEYSKYIAIEFDTTIRSPYKLVDERLERFVYRNEGNREKFRSVFKENFYDEISFQNKETSFPITIRGGANSNIHGYSFLLTIRESGSGAIHYSNVETYIVSIIGGHTAGRNIHRIVSTPLSKANGGIEFNSAQLLEEVVFKSTGTNEHPTTTGNVEINDEILIRIRTNTGYANIIPLIA